MHCATTGPEIWEDTEGRIDIFVAGVGTGGTVTGTGEYLKSRHPGIRVVAVEPASSPVLSGGSAGPPQNPGIGAGFVPPVLDTGYTTRCSPSGTRTPLSTARLIGRCEGVLVGIFPALRHSPRWSWPVSRKMPAKPLS